MYYIIVSDKKQALFHTFEQFVFDTKNRPPESPAGGFDLRLLFQMLLQHLKRLVADVVLHAAGVLLGHLVAHTDLL